MEQVPTSNDHDLLIRLHTLMEMLISEMCGLQAKHQLFAEKDSIRDIDMRLSVLEKAYWKLIGVGAGSAAVVSLLMKFVVKN